MNKGISQGIKVFFVLFIVLFIMNVLDIRLFSDALYSGESMIALLALAVLNGMFMRLE